MSSSFAERIVIPVVVPTNETMVDGQLYLVMRGRLLPQTMALALEHFTRQKLADGLAFRELESKQPLTLTRVEQLVEGTVYVRDATRDIVELCAMPGGRVRFRFQISKSEQGNAAELRISDLFAPRHNAVASSTSAAAPVTFESSEPRQLVRNIVSLVCAYSLVCSSRDRV